MRMKFANKFCRFLLLCIEIILLNVAMTVIPEGDASVVYIRCGIFSYEKGSETEKHLNAVLASLGRQIRLNGFGMSSEGDNTEKIYGYGQCKGVISRNDCFQCFTEAEKLLRQGCPQRKSGQMSVDGCILLYDQDPDFPFANQDFDESRHRLLFQRKDSHFASGPSSPPLPSPSPPVSNKPSDPLSLWIGLPLSLIVIMILLVAFRRKLYLLLSKGRVEPGKPETNNEFERLRDIGFSGSIITYFDYDVLKKATRNFHEENKLGKGGFGTVYKGTLQNGTIVAVKRLNNGKSKQGDDEFIREVKLITGIQHKNLVRLIGCCSEGSERLLVYEYMLNRSLDRILYGKSSEYLDWPTRFEIILGIARGLQYLHEDSHVRIVHRDIKASNILLDEKYQPKIADFGLARFFPENEAYLSTTFAGTLGYTAPEYATRGELSEKADIYSYGILVLEIVCCRQNTDLNLPSKMQYLPEWAWSLYEKKRILDLVDDRMEADGYDEKEVLRAIQVAFLCTQASPDLRPPMSHIVAMFLCSSEMAAAPMQSSNMGKTHRYNELPTWESISVDLYPSSSHDGHSLINESIPKEIFPI